MREKKFTADVGDTGVNLLVQQVVTGVLELAHLDVAQRPRQSRTIDRAIRSSVP